MRIGQLAHRAGVSIDTVRFYERRGVLPPARRRVSGYRIYGDEDLERLQFVRRAKRLGFSLDEIRDLLRLSADRRHGAAKLKSAAQEKLDLIERRIAELSCLREALRQLVNACPGRGALGECPIHNALTGESA